MEGRRALGIGATGAVVLSKENWAKDYSENYIINVFGDVPNAAPSNDDSADERKVKLDILKERTRLERKDDPIELNRVELAPATPLSPAGTLFYFSRALAIMPEDKQVTFVTKIGPLELKCKFTLKEMIYRGNPGAVRLKATCLPARKVLN